MPALAYWLLALATLPFSNGRWSFAVAAFLAPALLLGYMRTARKRAFLGGWIATTIAALCWWHTVFPLRGIPYVLASIVFGLIALTPYLVDRALAPRLHPLLGALVFPCAFVTLETVTMLCSPFSTWGAVAYTQFAVTPLVQVASLTGIAGITFVVTAFASVLHSRSHAAYVGYGVLLLAIAGFGFIRRGNGDGELVRIAAITPRIPTYTVRGDATNAPIHAALQSVRKRQPLGTDGWTAFRTRAAAIDTELLNATETEARNGAKVVVWSEGAGIVERSDEAALRARVAGVARRTRTYVLAAFLTLDARGSATFENKNVLVDPQGREIWTYRKARPVPGMEACIPGDGRIPVAPTPYGRIGTAICFDMDFPRLLRQTRADILLVPADDWREITPLHARMAAFRAVEQGFSLVRSTSNGLSLAVDRFGRVQASADFFAGARVMRAHVPRAGAPTLYARIGDAFPALAAIVLVALLFVSLGAPVRDFAPALRDLQ
ncbi:MAG TPA: nitrilase-related carbon-nitrogen hydrolase [Thermoanaerobaculia bacterium]|nr:nitrilase-related carbon-nitrogen hydrolase [Thermoanaerobaculia bacterium]